MKVETDPLTNTHEQEALHIASLLYGYIWESLTPEEHDELDNWVGASDENMYLFEELTDEHNIKKALDWLADKDGIRMSKKLKGKIRFTETGVSVRFFRYARRYSIAASLLLVISTTAFYLYKTTGNKNKTIASYEAQPVVIVAGSAKATLQLADKSSIVLNKVQDGNIAVQGSTTITKENGHINYSTGAGMTTGMINTVSTPRGGTYSMTLSDGTKVWLNSASSIRFPSAFTGNDRHVVISGEAYFEVASLKIPGTDTKRRFLVDLENRNTTVEVLGTHFNINSYTDEPLIKTTLAEGSIRITSGNAEQLVKPGQQAQVSSDHEIKLVTVNTDEAIAWKNGDLNLKHNDIATIMREISRWYDVEIVYEGNMPAVNFQASLRRDMKLQEVLDVLKENSIHTKIEGRKITVTP